MEKAIKMHTNDNVAVAIEALKKGSCVIIDGLSLLLNDDIPFAHKVAICAIAKGENVYKYGEAVGIATTDIVTGGHVHIHNVVSARHRVK